jgi:hypothetical protein
VQNRRDVVVEVAVDEPGRKFVLVEVFGDLAVDQIAELVRVLQVVDGDDLALATRVECLDQIRAMKPAAPVTMIYKRSP